MPAATTVAFERVRRVAQHVVNRETTAKRRLCIGNRRDDEHFAGSASRLGRYRGSPSRRPDSRADRGPMAGINDAGT